MVDAAMAAREESSTNLPPSPYSTGSLLHPWLSWQAQCLAVLEYITGHLSRLVLNMDEFVDGSQDSGIIWLRTLLLVGTNTLQ
jgi:hypothetical protein